MRVPWTEFVSNETVLGKVKEERQILTTITQRQLKFFGHVVRENGLEKLVLEGKIDGLRSRGRQRKKYLDDLVAAVGCLRKGELFHLTQDRERFKCIVANVNWYGTRRRRMQCANWVEFGCLWTRISTIWRTLRWYDFLIFRSLMKAL